MPTIQEDISAARKVVSRKTLAILSGLTESKIWRIENKGASDVEATALQPVLDRVLGRNVAAEAGIQVGGSPASTQLAALKATAAAATAVASPVSTEEVRAAQFDVVNWSTLRGIAAQVGDHEVERAQGPDPTLGFRLISNSEVQAFKRCRRKWWLTWYRKLKLREESPTGALAIGDRIHRALKLYYVPPGQTPVDPRDALEYLITQDWTRIAHLLQDDPLKLQALEKKFADEANLERAMIAGYVEWLAETGADSDLETVASETYLEAELNVSPVTPVKIIGKIDERVVRKTDGVRLFKDHKTVAELITIRQTVGGDEQMLHYHLLEWLGSKEGEERCDGALYNMLRKVKRTGNARPPFYDRVEVHHSVRELESFKTRLAGSITDMLDVEEALNRGDDPQFLAYPRWTRDCRWDCEFFAVCTMFDDGSRVEPALERWYRVGDPLEYYRLDTGTTEGEL